MKISFTDLFETFYYHLHYKYKNKKYKKALLGFNTIQEHSFLIEKILQDKIEILHVTKKSKKTEKEHIVWKKGQETTFLQKEIKEHYG